MTDFNFVENTFMVPYTEEVADYCDPFVVEMMIWMNSSVTMCFCMKRSCLERHIVG